VSMTKDQIKSAPDYDADLHRRDDDEYYESFGGYYRDYGW
jgi:hypothetical protein